MNWPGLELWAIVALCVSNPILWVSCCIWQRRTINRWRLVTDNWLLTLHDIRNVDRRGMNATHAIHTICSRGGHEYRTEYERPEGFIRGGSFSQAMRLEKCIVCGHTKVLCGDDLASVIEVGEEPAKKATESPKQEKR